MGHTRVTRKAALVAVCLLHLLLLLPRQGSGASEPRDGRRYRDTNVVMISIDTLRYDHLGCYGYTRRTSPSIDALAEQGVLFENFISQAVLTPVSQMSIFTSQHPRVNGVVSFQPAVDAFAARTLPEILQAYGYTNAAFIGSPEFMDARYVNTRSGGDNTQKLFSRAFDVYVPTTGGFRSVPREALEWIRANKDTKFFVWLPIGTVHWPYTLGVPAPDRATFDPKDYTPFFRQLLKGDEPSRAGGVVDANILSYIYKGRFYADRDNPYSLTERDAEYIIGRYDAGILHTDRFVGELFSLLESLELARKTLVVIYSTHGEDLGEHGYFGHYDLYDTETKNALLLRFPGDEHGGMRLRDQVQGIDIAPSLLDYLGIPLHHEMQGTSWMPRIAGGPQARDDDVAYITRIPLFEFVLFKGRRLFQVATRKDEVLTDYMELLAQYLGTFSPEEPPFDVAARTNDWKLILRRHATMLKTISWWRFASGSEVDVPEVELYDLRQDPTEQKDVAAEHPEVVRGLRAKLGEWEAAMAAQIARNRDNAEHVLIPYP